LRKETLPLKLLKGLLTFGFLTYVGFLVLLLATAWADFEDPWVGISFERPSSKRWARSDRIAR